MLDWFFVPPAESRLLGAARLAGPTPWVIAIMSFSIILIAATGLALANTAGVLSRAIEARYALELPGGGANHDAAVSAIRSAPGVASVEVVESEMRKTLERWLGPSAQSSELPVPTLVNFDIREGANLDAIQSRVQQLDPAARIVAHRETVGPLLHSLTLLQAVAFGLVLLLSAAAAAAVVLAAKGALDTHRFTIEVMHGIGATDIQSRTCFSARSRSMRSIQPPSSGICPPPACRRSGIRRRTHRRRDPRVSRSADPCPAAVRAYRPGDLGCSPGGAAGIARSPMITRLGSLLLLAYALGFVLFAFTLGKPAPARAAPTDAAVVLTAGGDRACDRRAQRP
jgi:cell division transport system permease protein